MVVNKKNPFAFKAKQSNKKKTSGKRVGKSGWESLVRRKRITS